MAWFRRPLTVVELLVNAASAAQDVLAEQNGVDVVGGTVGIGRIDIWYVINTQVIIIANDIRSYRSHQS